MGQSDFGKLELNNRNHSGNCQRLSAKRDQFETKSIWNYRGADIFRPLGLLCGRTRLLLLSTFLQRALYRRAIHKFIIIRHFNVFTGTLPHLQASQLQSAQASTVTGLIFSEPDAVFTTKHFIFFISPILLKLGRNEDDPTTNDRLTNRKYCLVSGLLYFSMCQNNDN